MQKGGDTDQDIAKLAEFIRKKVPERHAEHELKEWGKFYQSLIESQTDIICRIGPDGVFRYINEECDRGDGEVQGIIQECMLKQGTGFKGITMRPPLHICHEYCRGWRAPGQENISAESL